MSLHLDARQRAMLQEMGVTVWSPVARVHADTPPGPAAKAPLQVSLNAPAPEPVPAPPARTQPGASAATPVTRPAPSPGPAQASGAVFTQGLVLHAPQPLYPDADPAQTPPELGASWLIVMECGQPGAPLAGDVGRLLDNMLRAMRLHRHPQTWLAALERPLAGTTSSAAAPATDVGAALASTVAALHPAMVLVLGHAAARAALGSAEPLGRLRAEVHQLAGSPAIVSYEPAHLLRSASAKPAAWADLCRALAIVRTAVRATAKAV